MSNLFMMKLEDLQLSSKLRKSLILRKEIPHITYEI